MSLRNKVLEISTMLRFDSVLDHSISCRWRPLTQNESCRPQITDEQKVLIPQVLENDSRGSICDAKWQTAVSKSTILQCFCNKLHIFPYTLRVCLQRSAQHKRGVVDFGQFCHLVLTEVAVYLKRITYSSKCSFSLSGDLNKQQCPTLVNRTPARSVQSATRRRLKYGLVCNI